MKKFLVYATLLPILLLICLQPGTVDAQTWWDNDNIEGFYGETLTVTQTFQNPRGFNIYVWLIEPNYWRTQNKYMINVPTSIQVRDYPADWDALDFPPSFLYTLGPGENLVLEWNVTVFAIENGFYEEQGGKIIWCEELPPPDPTWLYDVPEGYFSVDYSRLGVTSKGVNPDILVPPGVVVEEILAIVSVVFVMMFVMIGTAFSKGKTPTMVIVLAMFAAFITWNIFGWMPVWLFVVMISGLSLFAAKKWIQTVFGGD